MTTYYTFRDKVKLLAGQVVEFLTGKGYYAAGTPTDVTMYDSVTISEIPANAAAVAGYVGGQWPTYPTLEKKFPNALKVSIAINITETADVLDVETGDVTNADAPGWVKRQLLAGKHPTVYTSLANAMALRGMLQKAGVASWRYNLWTAHYTNKPHRCTSKCGFGFTGTADATQYTSNALGRNLDASLCASSFFSSL